MLATSGLKPQQTEPAGHALSVPSAGGTAPGTAPPSPARDALRDRTFASSFSRSFTAGRVNDDHST